LQAQLPTEDSRSDEQLIALVNQGDVEAFAVLYRRHRDWVVHLAMRFTGDHALALDVMQELFLYFLRKFPGFTLRRAQGRLLRRAQGGPLSCQLRSFFYPAVRNLSLAARRKAARHQADETELPELAAPAVQGGPGAADDPAASRAALQEVVGTLPEPQREVLFLRFVDELSLQEIADALEIPLGTVKSRLFHALQALRQSQRVKKFYAE
jgi:RNA polymerase sigma-70 factor (ECF subfamily)